MSITIADYDVTEAMIQFGGEFVAQLGRLFRLADADNQATLKAAFPEYWATYRDRAARASDLQRDSVPEPLDHEDMP